MPSEEQTTKTLPSDILAGVNQWLKLVIYAKQQIEALSKPYNMTFDEVLAMVSERESTFESINEARIRELEAKIGQAPTTEPG